MSLNLGECTVFDVTQVPVGRWIWALIQNISVAQAQFTHKYLKKSETILVTSSWCHSKQCIKYVVVLWCLSEFLWRKCQWMTVEWIYFLLVTGVVLKASSVEIHKVLLIAFSPVITDGSPDSAWCDFGYRFKIGVFHTPLTLMCLVSHDARGKENTK